MSAPYYDKLINHIRESVLLETDPSALAKLPPNKGAWAALDQYWKLLQVDDNWQAFTPRLSRQRGSFSDIELRYMDYGV